MSVKLYIGNLPWSVNDVKLKEIFSKFGEMTEAMVISDKFSGRSKGFGFITFESKESADAAIAEMNGKEFDGRAIKVNEARPMEERPKRSFRERRFWFLYKIILDRIVF